MIILRFTLFSLLIGFIIWVALLLLNFGLARAEKVECQTWQVQAAQYSEFYLTQWQAAQCEANGFNIDAVVK